MTDLRSPIALARSPLRKVFWGGLLCVLDFSFTMKFGRDTVEIDVLNDFVGTILIVIGVVRLRALDDDRAYRRDLGFVSVVAVVSSVKAFAAHFPVNSPHLLDLLGSLFPVLVLTSIVVFCLAMRTLCRFHDLAACVASWTTTTTLFVVIFVIPLGIFHMGAFFALVTGGSFRIRLGLWGLPVIGILLIPLVHLFVSTSRMARSAETVPAPV